MSYGKYKIPRTFIFSQPTASDHWVIDHNLNTIPAVDVIILDPDNNDAPTKIIAFEVYASTANRLEVSFTTAYKGTANLVG